MDKFGMKNFHHIQIKVIKAVFIHFLRLYGA